jgi:hypothetical protein
VKSFLVLITFILIHCPSCGVLNKLFVLSCFLCPMALVVSKIDGRDVDKVLLKYWKILFLPD